jgi:hypothetical protein
MLKHYSHIRMAAKREALEGIVAKPKPQDPAKSDPDGRDKVVELSQPVSKRRGEKSASAA